MLDAALAYAARGWPVHPCREKPGEPYTDEKGRIITPQPKSPYLKHGVQDASTDPQKIRAWWARWPGAAIGIDCGGAGLLVIDCDVKKGPDGVAAFESLGITHTGALHSQTPSNGLHIVFRNSSAVLGNSTGALPAGIDVRGAGGYIIAPPSQIEGDNGGAYVALDDWNREPAELPGAIRALLAVKAEKSTSASTRNTGAPLSLDDSELLQRARNAKNGADFVALFDRGSLAAHANDASRADLALCCMLAFWSGRDASQIDRLFRRSALMRDKWDEKHRGDGTTYGQMTIDKALALCEEVYTPLSQNGAGKESAAPVATAEKTAPSADAATSSAGGEDDTALLAAIESCLETAPQEEGAARDRLLAEILPLLLRAPALAQARYKREVLRAFPELTARDLAQLLKDARRGNGNGNGERYTIEDGCHCAIRYVNGERYTETLCNFTAEVLDEVARDDGTGAPIRALTVGGRLADGASLPVGTVDAGKFAALGWVNELWGMRAVIRAGRDTKDRLREAIQLENAQVAERYIYTHTGWRDIGGRRVYLTNAGALGSADGVTVELDRDLARYRLPAQPDNIAEAMRASLRFLDIAPLEITAPLWAAAFLAPLAEVIYPDFVLWLYGKTGTLKSTLAALALSHYGAFDDKALFSWGDTANRLEMACFLLKDTLMVIDDFAPQSDPFKAREMERNAAQIVRNVGNQAGRGRLRRDLTMATTYRPRGLVVSTGEQVPDGQSITARVFTLELQPGSVDLERLTSAQAEAGQYPHALGGYLLWLAGQWGSLAAQLPDELRAIRDYARAELHGRHLRLPGALAHLNIGLELGLRFAVEVGALAETEAEALKARAWEALLHGSQAQAQRVERERPTLRFLEVLLSLLAQGKARLNRRDGLAHIGGGAAGEELLGWYDAEFLYILGGAAYNRVARFMRDEGALFPVKEPALRKYMIEEQILQPAEEGRTADVIRVGDETRRALRLSRAQVIEIAGDLPREKDG